MNFTEPHLAVSPCLSLSDRGVVTIYGAGGKTSLMETLTREGIWRGKRVIQTTTTKIFRPTGVPVVIGENWNNVSNRLRDALKPGASAVLGAALLPKDKLAGIDPAWPEALLEKHVADYVIVEADGSARKPIKGYAPYEPVFPTRSDVLVPVLGVEAIGRPVNDENVHRSEVFCMLTGARPNEPLAVTHFLKSMRHMIEIGRANAPGVPIIPLFNKIDRLSGVGVIHEICRGLAGSDRRLLFTSLRDENPVRFVYQDDAACGFNVSVVVLAAGGSVRMGCPKLSLEVKGKPILAHVFASLGGTGVKDVVVVFSKENEKLRHLVPPEYRIIINRESREGISTSLKAGLAAVDPCSQGILFVLGDQPFVETQVCKKLIRYHQEHLPLLTRPVYGGQKGNPVLFDRRLWPALSAVMGDEGGKQIAAALSAAETGLVDVDDPGVLIDIDTPEEYEKYRMKGEPRG